MGSSGMPPGPPLRSPVAGKARLHELAKELGISSKDVLAKLAELGEYVKGPSSTVEAPVVRRLHEAFPAAPAAKAPAKKAAAKSAPTKAAAAKAAAANGVVASDEPAASVAVADPVEPVAAPPRLAGAGQ